MKDYRPIACRVYAELELAIMRHVPLRIAWRTDSGRYSLETLEPQDVQVRCRAEYLLARGRDGRQRNIRLDRIYRLQPLAELEL